MEPYYDDRESGIALYLGDMREVLPALDTKADLILTDPPYSETSLAWDRWPDGWPPSHPVGPKEVAEVLRGLLATGEPTA